MKRRLPVLLLTLFLLVPALTGLAQSGGTIESLLDVAVTRLGEQLGTSLTRSDLANWTWQEKIFANASMDCPQPDQVYAEVLTQGYIFLLQYQGATYEYHVSADGQAVTFCGSAAAPPATPVPATTVPQATPVAQQTPTTPTQVDPEQLVDVGIAYLNDQLALNATRTNFSAWTWEAAIWPDTGLGCPVADVTYDNRTPVAGHIIKLTYSSTEYELHMTNDGRTIMPCNSDLLTPVTDGPGLQPGETDASAAAPAAVIAYTGADGNVYLAFGEDFPGQSVTKDVTDTQPEEPSGPIFDRWYGDYRWSPDGGYLAFVDSRQLRLMLAPVSGATPVVLAENLTVAYPPAWSPAGNEVAYIVPAGEIQSDQRQPMEIYAVSISAAGEVGAPRLVASFGQTVGCGGGSPDPADARYQMENGFMGNALSFDWLADGSFLLSDSCSGIGLVRLDSATGEVSVIDADLARVALNPDQTHAAGIVFDENRNGQLAVVDLGSGTRQIFALAATPDQVAWTADGAALLVSTVDPLETVTDPVDQNQYTYSTVRLWQVGEAEPTLLFEQEGRGIGHIHDFGDGSLIFDFVEGSRSWFTARAEGKTGAELRATAPAIWILRLDSAGQITRLGQGRHATPLPDLTAEVG